MSVLGSAPPDQADRGAAGPPARARRMAPRRLGRLSTGHVLMLLAGTVAVLANYTVLRGVDETVAVLVADAPIAAGVPLEPGMLAVAEVAAGGALPDRLVAADRRETIRGMVSAAPVTPGDPLRDADLREAAAPDGRRAMSVPVEAGHAAGGALAPGDRVDVIETVDGTAAYLVTGAEVLAVADGGALDGLRGFNLTIAVGAGDALRLAEAIHARDLDVVRATGARPPAAADRR